MANKSSQNSFIGVDGVGASTRAARKSVLSNTHFLKGTLAGAAGSLLWSLDGLLVRIVHANAGQIFFGGWQA